MAVVKVKKYVGKKPEKLYDKYWDNVFYAPLRNFFKEKAKVMSSEELAELKADLKKFDPEVFDTKFIISQQRNSSI